MLLDLVPSPVRRQAPPRRARDRLQRRARRRRVAHLLRPHRSAALGVAALSLFAACLGAVEPVMLKQIFDQLGRPTAVTFRVVLPWTLGLAGLALGREALNGMGNWLMWRTRLRLQHRLLDRAVERLHRLPMEYHRDHGIGGVMTRLDRGIQGLVTAFGDTLAHLVPAFAYLIVSIAVMLQLSVTLSVMVLLLVPLPAVIAALAAGTQVHREARLLDRWAGIYSRFHEVLSGLVTVRSFAMEDAEKRRFLDGVAETNREVETGVGFDTRVGAMQSTVVTVARVVALGMGAYHVVRGDTTVGTVIAFLGYVGGLFGPVQSLSGLYSMLRKAGVSVDAVLSILDAKTSIGDSPHAVDPGPLSGEIRLDHVRFGYSRHKPPVLDGVSLHVAPGESVALVGPSGSGKSTLTALVQRFYDPQEGTVQLDGYDVRDLKQVAVRRQMGVVLQDPLLFNDTVFNNIAYGRPDAMREEVLEAARAAEAEEFILTLPEGYDTVIGERGGRLSVGERQRIAIARAMLGNPPIAILDEATSALDAETEAKVQEALDHLLAGRSSLVIAHRLATVVRADRIVVLRRGRIEQEGTHEELMRDRQGYYAELVRKQTHGLLGD